MRENRVLDKKKLPGSVYEVWLGEQRPERETKAHRPPPPDIYETWLKELVRRRTSRRL